MVSQYNTKVYHTMNVLLEYIDRSLQFFINVVYIFPIMLASCLMLSMTQYAQNFAGIIGMALTMDRMHCFFRLIRIRLITG